jgi:integrase
VYFEWCDEFEIDALTARRIHLDGYRRHLESGGAGRTYAAATVYRRLSSVSSFYRYATREHDHFVAANPAENIRRPKVSTESATSGLDRDELLRLLATADASSPRDSALIRMLAYTAARITELCLARTSDLTADRGHRILCITRKAGARDRVVLPPPAAVALDRHLNDRRGYLFVCENGRDPMTRRAAAYHVQKLAALAGIGKRITPHSFRHTAATLALDAGVDLRDVQRMLGHKRVETTMRYDRSRTSVDKSPAHTLARVLEGDAE